MPSISSLAPPHSRILLAAVAAALLAATPASAEPKYNGTVSASAPVFKWNGGPINGVVTASNPVGNTVPCATPGAHECEETLVKVNDPGRIVVKIAGDGNSTTVDLDLFVHTSDASGKTGKMLGSSTSGTANESVSKEIEAPGYILVRVEAYTGVAMTYAGSATLEPGAGGEDLPATAQLGKLAKSVKASKLKSFKGTASDDNGVARVEVGLIQTNGRKCKQLTASGQFAALKRCSQPTRFIAAKGTTAWTFKLKKTLEKGRYTLFARAIDSAGQTQSGFSAASRRAFKVT